MSKNIAIIGAGLAGLNCAKNLEKIRGATIDLYEKSNSIGGRIKTDKFDGFLLDHGFQVFLPNYPEARISFDYQKLQLFSFKAGAKINGKYVGDPFREPEVLLPTLFSSIGTLKDKLLILKMRYEKVTSRNNQTAHEFLKDYGFIDQIIENFFKPFFSGVFLNKNLENSASFFLFLYRLFSRAYATLPQDGMQELPKNLADQLKKTNISLSTSVEIIDSQTIKLPNGEIKNYDFVISAHALKEAQFYSVITDYFWVNHENAQRFSKALELFTDKKYINHIAPISLANPNYAPKDKVLLSVNSLEVGEVKDIQSELEAIFPGVVFNFLKRFEIKEALPKAGQNNLPDDQIIRCGDYLETPSINGALVSGRKAAEKVKALLP